MAIYSKYACNIALSFWLSCQVGLFTGAVFMQQSLGLNLYVCTAILIGIVAVLTLAGIGPNLCSLQTTMAFHTLKILLK